MKSSLKFFLAGCWMPAFLFPMLAIAQPLREFTRLPAELTGGAEVYAFSDAQGATLLMKEGRSAHLWVLDANGGVAFTQDLTDLPLATDMALVGFTNAPDQLQICYRGVSDGAFYRYSVGKNGTIAAPRTSATARLAQISEADGYGAYWGEFTYQGVLHVVRLPRRSHTVRLCRFEPNGVFTTREFELDRTDFFERVNYQLTPIAQDETLTAGDCYQPGKMYTLGSRLLLTLDVGDTTHIVDLDLNSMEKSERELFHRGFGHDVRGLRPDYRGISFIKNDQLFYLAATADSLRLRVTDLPSRAERMDWRFGKSSIPFWSGIQYVEQIGDSVTNNQLSPDEFWYGSAAPLMGLAVNTLEDGMLEISGGFVQPNQETGITGMVISERNMGILFRSAFDPYNFQPAALTPIFAGSRRVRPTPPLPTRFLLAGKPCRGYFDPRTRQYVIVAESR